MLIAALITISLISLCVAKAIYFRFINPISLYVLPWTIATSLAVTGLYGIFKPNRTTILIIIISLSIYVLTCVIWQVMVRIRTQRKERTDLALQNNMSSPSRGRLKMKVGNIYASTGLSITVLAMLSISIELYLAFKSIPLLMAGETLTRIKFEFANTDGSTLYTTYELILFQWIALPILYVVILMFSYRIVEQKIDGKLLIFSVIGSFLYVLISGGRSILLTFAIFIILTYTFRMKSFSLMVLIKKLPKTVKILIVIAAIVLILITTRRSLGSEAGVLENFFFYFVGPITFFNELLRSPEIYHLDASGLLYGRATFGFITNPIEIIISIILGIAYEGSDVAITGAVANPIPISNGVYANAFCTSLYHFMRDFGSAGVLLGPVLFASLVSYVWQKAFIYKTRSESWLLACVYLGYCIIFSEWRYNLTFPHSGVVFFLIFLLSKTSTRRESHTKSSNIRVVKYNINT